jgi:hypothetical protein
LQALQLSRARCWRSTFPHAAQLLLLLGALLLLLLLQ